MNAALRRMKEAQDAAERERLEDEAEKEAAELAAREKVKAKRLKLLKEIAALPEHAGRQRELREKRLARQAEERALLLAAAEDDSRRDVVGDLVKRDDLEGWSASGK